MVVNLACVVVIPNIFVFLQQPSSVGAVFPVACLDGHPWAFAILQTLLTWLVRRLIFEPSMFED